MSDSLSDSQEELRLDYGVRMRYDYATGELGAVSGDGHIKTYFIPDDPIDYWEGMVNMYGKRQNKR